MLARNVQLSPEQGQAAAGASAGRSVIPTRDGRMAILRRYTQAQTDLKLLLERLELELPAQPPPRITVAFGQAPSVLQCRLSAQKAVFDPVNQVPTPESAKPG